MDIGEHFVHLSVQQPQLEEVQLLTRNVVASPQAGHILAGIDAIGHRHLLVPVHEDQELSAFGTNAISVSIRELSDRGEASHFLDISCTDPSLFLVFDRLAEEIISRVLRPGAHAVNACMSTLEDWRAIIDTASRPTPSSTVAGLVGELSLLEKLAEIDPTGAIGTWVGPSGAVHDFESSNNSAFEVKATTLAEGNRVKINGLDQLDYSTRAALHLAVFHLRKSPSAESLDNRIDRLISLGVPRSALIERVAQAGYVYESGTDIATRFDCVSARFWIVDGSFPGLKRSDLTPTTTHGIENIRFDLLLDSAPPPLPVESVETLFREWMNNE